MPFRRFLSSSPPRPRSASARKIPRGRRVRLSFYIIPIRICIIPQSKFAALPLCNPFITRPPFSLPRLCCIFVCANSVFPPLVLIIFQIDPPSFVARLFPAVSAANGRLSDAVLTVHEQHGTLAAPIARFARSTTHRSPDSAFGDQTAACRATTMGSAVPSDRSQSSLDRFGLNHRWPQRSLEFPKNAPTAVVFAVLSRREQDRRGKSPKSVDKGNRILATRPVTAPDLNAERFKRSFRAK